MTEMPTLPLRLYTDKVRLIAEAVARRPDDTAVTAPKADALTAKYLVEECLNLAAETRRFWDWLWWTAEATDRLDADRVGDRMEEAFAGAVRVMEQVAAQAREVASRSGRAIDRLAELETTVPELRDWTERCLAAWPRPSRIRSEPDPEVIARARASLDAGNGEDLEDIIARFQAGGPLVKE